MNNDETRFFAQKLMDEVWRPFNSSAMPRFYHSDVIGHHRRSDGSTQELSYTDVANRLDWDKQTSASAVYDIRDIITESDKLALRFVGQALVVLAFVMIYASGFAGGGVMAGIRLGIMLEIAAIGMRWPSTPSSRFPES